MTVAERLIALADPEYKQFILRLNPEFKDDNVIGVRVPEIRKLAKELSSDEIKTYLTLLPHNCREENLLHGFLLSHLGKDFDFVIAGVEKFLPYVDGWEISDTMMPKKCFSINTDRLFPYIVKWLKSELTYTVRFGLVTLMDLYLDKHFTRESFELAVGVRSTEYYVMMAQAWYIATALAKQYDTAAALIESKTLPKWVHNKSIQKAIESYRVSDERKAYLRSLKV